MKKCRKYRKVATMYWATNIKRSKIEAFLGRIYPRAYLDAHSDNGIRALYVEHTFGKQASRPGATAIPAV